MKYYRASLILTAGFFIISAFTGNTIPQANAAAKENITVQQAAKTQEKDDIKVTFIELGSMHCMPCRMMQPIVDEIKEEYSGQVKVIFYDVWAKEGQPYAEQYKIQAIPTQVFLDKNGKEYFRHLGFFSKKDIIKTLEMQGVNKAAETAGASAQKNINKPDSRPEKAAK